MATATATYMITYAVPADTKPQALMKAGGLLRTDVRVLGEAETRAVTPFWWEVTFLLAEDYPVPDAIDTAAVV